MDPREHFKQLARDRKAHHDKKRGALAEFEFQGYEKQYADNSGADPEPDEMICCKHNLSCRFC